jgi:hypothetical protein
VALECGQEGDGTVDRVLAALRRAGVAGATGDDDVQLELPPVAESNAQPGRLAAQPVVGAKAAREE